VGCARGCAQAHGMLGIGHVAPGPILDHPHACARVKMKALRGLDEVRRYPRTKSGTDMCALMGNTTSATRPSTAQQPRWRVLPVGLQGESRTIHCGGLHRLHFLRVHDHPGERVGILVRRGKDAEWTRCGGSRGQAARNTNIVICAVRMHGSHHSRRGVLPLKLAACPSPHSRAPPAPWTREPVTQR
jgi:hypothetical protein